MPDATVSITLSGVPAALAVGQSVPVVARVTTDVPDGALDAQPVVWSSSAPAVASITATATGATVTAISAGTAVIRAAIGVVSGTATLTVSVPTIPITAQQEAAIMAVAVGGRFTLKGPTRDIVCQVSG